MDAHVTAAGRLRVLGQRYTPNRRALVDLLHRTSRPLSITDLLERERSLAQSSAYRNLLVLEQAGIVRRVSGSDDFSRFELTEDLIGHHHHLICSSCGAIEDFDAPANLERAMTRLVEQVAGVNRFDVEDHHLQLTGLCADCA